MEYSALKSSLPQNIQILTLEPWKNSTLLLRLEHILEMGDESSLPDTVQLSFKNLFKNMEIMSARETTLAANQFLEDSKRLEWKSTKPHDLSKNRKVNQTTFFKRTYITSHGNCNISPFCTKKIALGYI
ncbi:hypothetical protein L9F63_004650 [Diploptera punctata]|uniref:Glycosyl hydrolases family 38 C-terminal domain-containing protein n=1 Tax=Diploptera punctata TaxID=6984 RepID=A0AAD7ZFE4_DIPPU|nr:hypothetical protein L9F63_004650 [Diploptera punctata]